MEQQNFFGGLNTGVELGEKPLLGYTYSGIDCTLGQSTQNFFCPIVKDSLSTYTLSSRSNTHAFLSSVLSSKRPLTDQNSKCPQNL